MEFCVTNLMNMQLLRFLNTMLLVGFLAVLAGFALLFTGMGNDKTSHFLFILHATNGFLLLARAAFGSDGGPTKAS